MKHKTNAQNVNTNGKPTVISAFAGGGGSSLGYKMAGFKELLAIEFNKNAVETLKLNFKGLKIWDKDIKDLTVRNCLKLAKIKKSELDILDGSPPCQGFSTAGKRDVIDNRNDLFKEFVRLINGLQPKVFVMENVPGMVRGRMKGKFVEIIKELKSTGYNVKCKLLNAMWYEVPQSRERLIFVGVRKNLKKEPVFPTKKSKIPITVKKALLNVKNKTFAPIPNGAEIIFSQIKQGKSAIKSVNKKDLLKYIPRMIKNKKYIFDSICVRLDNKKPSQTITKTFIPYSDPPIHPTENRYLTIEEAKILTGFSNNYKLTGTFVNQWARIGNSVPPKMMYHIAKTIKDKILNGDK